MGSHVEHEHDPFIKQINYTNQNMTRTYLVSILVYRQYSRFCKSYQILLPLIQLTTSFT